MGDHSGYCVPEEGEGNAAIYQCDLCDRVYKKKGDLASHKRISHGFSHNPAPKKVPNHLN